MKKLLEFKINDGETLIFETEISEEEIGMLPVSRTGNSIAQATQTFETSLQKIKKAANDIVIQLKKLRDCLISTTCTCKPP